MNKKFSTLMALALLAGGASAQVLLLSIRKRIGSGQVTQNRKVPIVRLRRNLLRVHRQIIQLWMLLV